MGRADKSILIFGATGMLGRELYCESKKRGFKTVGASRRGPDIANDLLDEDSVSDLIGELSPDIIINSSVIVSHAECEENPTLAYGVNSRAVEIMATAATTVGSRLVQISTDHYFSGDGPKLHDEQAPVQLLNEYARTKYAGETFALTCPGALVVRTNITGFRDGGGVVSFIEWVISVLESNEEFNLFEDYYTSTISTHQAAAILFDLLAHDVEGRINLACREAASKQRFVETVAKRIGRATSHARPISVRNVLVDRAESVGLDVSRAEKILGYRLPDLEEVVERLASEYEERQQPTPDRQARQTKTG